jgi:MFS family permease
MRADISQRRHGGATGYGAIIFLIALTQLVITSDFLIISVALPSIGRDMNGSPAALSWVISANALAFAGFMTIGGRAADMFGRKSCFLFGAILFALAGLLSALSPNLDLLIATRALQGFGTAILAPVNFSLLNTMLPEGPVRNRAFGIFGMVQAGSLFLGLLLGGALVTAVGWRAIFVLNLPLIALICVLAWQHIPRAGAIGARQSFDIAGAVLVVAATALFVRSVSALGESGWRSLAGFGNLGVALVALAILLFVEGRVRDPLLPLSVFRHVNVKGGNLVTLCMVAAAGALFVPLNLYFQRVLNYSALMSGLALMPYAAGILLGGFLAGQGMNRWRLRTNMMIGTAAASISLLLFQLVLRPGSGLADFALAEILAATSVIFSLVSSQAAATRAVPAEQQGTGSAVQLMAQQFGTAIGTSVALGLISSSIGAGETNAVAYRSALLAASALVGVAFVIALLLTRAAQHDERAVAAGREADESRQSVRS